MNTTPTEQQEAEALAAWLRVGGYHFTHIPNETGQDPAARRRAVRMKRAGVSRGFPDYLVFRNGHRWAIELKRQKGGVVRPEQRQWLRVLSDSGFSCAICHGWLEASEFIKSTEKARKVLQ